MKERGPQPAPEQTDPILNWARQEEKLSRILTRPASVYERVDLGELRKRLEQAHSETKKFLRNKLVEEGKEFVVFEAPKPPKRKIVTFREGFGIPEGTDIPALLDKIADRSRARKEKRVKKSRGLKDPRPIEFSVPGTGKKLRGKEGKMVKSLKGARNRTLDRDQLAQRLQPGVKLETARVRVNTTARRARQSLHGSPLDIKITRDYERKTTNYSLVDRSKRKKKH